MAVIVSIYSKLLITPFSSPHHHPHQHLHIHLRVITIIATTTVKASIIYKVSLSSAMTHHHQNDISSTPTTTISTDNQKPLISPLTISTDKQHDHGSTIQPTFHLYHSTKLYHLLNTTLHLNTYLYHFLPYTSPRH